jgi:hypothetical protein
MRVDCITAQFDVHHETVVKIRRGLHIHQRSGTLPGSSAFSLGANG